MVGSPDQPHIISNNQGLHTNTYNLQWRVFSPRSFPVLNQSILYRRIKQVGSDRSSLHISMFAPITSQFPLFGYNSLSSQFNFKSVFELAFNCFSFIATRNF